MAKKAAERKPGVAARVAELTDRVAYLMSRIESMTQTMSALVSRIDLKLEVERVERLQMLRPFEESPLRVMHAQRRLALRKDRKRSR